MLRRLRHVIALDQVRDHLGAAVGDDRGHLRHLERRHQHRALADRHRDRLAGVPRASRATLRLHAVSGTSPFFSPADLDAGEGAEAEEPRVVGDPLDPHPLAEGVEVDVAGVLERAAGVDRAVPALLPAAEVAAVEDARRRRSRPAVCSLKTPSVRPAVGHDDLERRARRVGVLDRPVLQRMVGVLDQGLPLVLLQPPREQVRVVRRRRDHGQDLAVARVHAPRSRRPSPGRRASAPPPAGAPGRASASGSCPAPPPAGRTPRAARRGCPRPPPARRPRRAGCGRRSARSPSCPPGRPARRAPRRRSISFSVTSPR